MSLVGPRPERPELQERIEKELPEFRLRLQATEDELDTWIAEEKITDGFTLAGYSMYQAKRKNI